jgi:eukaryotic translation initiation factor 2-alpha kinase 4
VNEIQARKRREETEKEQAYEREREREYEIQEEIRMNAEKLYQARKRAMSDVTEVPMDEEASSRTLTETFAEDIEWQSVRFRKVHLFHPEKGVC